MEAPTFLWVLVIGLFYSKINSTDFLIQLPSPTSAPLVAGSYAILFRNNGNVQANLNITQNVVVSLQSCA